MSGIDWLVIGLYFVGLLVVGVLFARRNTSASEMFVAGRSSPWWLSGVSAYMTMFSAGTFVVWGGITYEFGMVGPIICAVYGIAAFLAGRFFAGRWHDTGLSTAAEFVQLRFSKGAFNFYTIYRGLYLTVHGLSLYALAVMLCPLMPLEEGHFLRDAATGNLSVDWACTILALIVITYTMIGGLWAVLMTDMIQFIVLSACVIVVVPLILKLGGSVEQIAANSPEGFFLPTAPGFTWFFLVGWMLVNCFQLGAEWHFIQRHLCVPSAKDARKAMNLFGWLYLVTPFLWMAPPLIYRSINGDADPQESYILACKAVLPAGLIGLMVAAMFSATASSLSSIMNMFAGVLTDDVYRKRIRPHATEAESVKVGRIFTLLIGVYMLAGALILPRLGNYRDIVILVGSLIGSSVLLPTLWALFSKRVGKEVVWWTLFGGIGVSLVYKFGFKEGGWFEGIAAFSGLMEFIATYSRESDLVVGVMAPLVILLIAELRAKSDSERALRLQEAIATASQEGLTLPAEASRLPLQVLTWSFGILSGGMFILILFSRKDWATLSAMGLLLGTLCALFIYLQTKLASKDVSSDEDATRFSQS
ncbi:sodium:solute symporter family protein [Coraliomargarita akajimensis]|uniref:Na+/solute symporter n=1 Tax=Coraliomargarita akajimensis (strain DSM 45221 / IAM 15411 / JCM 23193 / KCTC 12865 / 04OKA010-24) TaxID=583355 RepID=D5EQ84_CORAD|nr:sodium:solute symporter family protein [Coraliomargarita akajimensis]ADE53852.1 Na+/solute symporter [Coraliomargarita akajimensis DSM 45221]